MEWHVGRVLTRIRLPDAAVASFRAVTGKGWPAAFRDGAVWLEALS